VIRAQKLLRDRHWKQDVRFSTMVGVSLLEAEAHEVKDVVKEI